MDVILERIPHTKVDLVRVDGRLVGQVEDGQISVARDWSSIGDPNGAVIKDAPIVLFRRVTERVKTAIAKKVIDTHTKGDVVFYDPPPPITPEMVLKYRHRLR